MIQIHVNLSKIRQNIRASLSSKAMNFPNDIHKKMASLIEFLLLIIFPSLLFKNKINTVGRHLKQNFVECDL